MLPINFLNQSAGVMPLAVKPRMACLLLGCGLTKLYEKLAAGELESYRDGRSRLITMRSIMADVEHRVAASKSDAGAG